MRFNQHIEKFVDAEYAEYFFISRSGGIYLCSGTQYEAPNTDFTNLIDRMREQSAQAIAILGKQIKSSLLLSFIFRVAHSA